jgi:hypothetical protein
VTAEVVILNKSAAVLAADSAVTIQTSRARKTYNSASKIAMVSRQPPIGAIVYGTADLLGVPWESIKRMYRDHLRSETTISVESVSAVADGFFDWLDDNGKWLFGEACQAQAVLSVDAALDELRTALPKTDDPAALDEAASAFTRSKLNSFSLDTDIEQKREATLAEYQETFDQLINRHAARTPAFRRISSAVWQEIGRFLADAVCNDALQPDSQETGIAFAGIGSCQFHPELMVYSVRGILNNKVERSPRPITRGVSGRHPAHIELLGQTAEIEALLDGVHPRYQKRIDEVLGQLSGRLSKMVSEVLLTKNVNITEYLPALQGAMDVVIEGSLGLLVDARRRKPILEMIADLPTPELVSAAEALVSLTALQQRVGPDIETVGLPVDIAVASRSDGFIWVHRKRYFQPELNRKLDEDM